MTKANISQRKIIAEYTDAGKFTIVTFDIRTGERVSSYGNIDMHVAFSEALKRLQNGTRFLVLQFPHSMSVTERLHAQKTYTSAIKYAAEFPIKGR